MGALASDLICDAFGVADSSIISTELGVYLGNELSAQFFAGETWNLKAEVLRTFSEECPYINRLRLNIHSKEKLIQRIKVEFIKRFIFVLFIVVGVVLLTSSSASAQVSDELITDLEESGVFVAPDENADPNLEDIYIDQVPVSYTHLTLPTTPYV